MVNCLICSLTWQYKSRDYCKHITVMLVPLYDHQSLHIYLFSVKKKPYNFKRQKKIIFEVRLMDNCGHALSLKLIKVNDFLLSLENLSLEKAF